MLPEDKSKEPTTEPVTPEFEVPPHSSHSLCVLQPSAPKGKPRSAPLIRGKVLRSEADVDGNPVSNGSKIPLLKSKFTESDERNKRDERIIPKKIQRTATSASNYDYSNRERRLDNIPHHHPENRTTVEKIKVSRGIEMKRVVHESSSVKSKKSTSGDKSQVTGNSDGSAGAKAPSGKIRISSDSRKKMTKTEVDCFAEVKPHTFTGHFRSFGKTLRKKTVHDGDGGEADSAPASKTNNNNDDHAKNSDTPIVPEPTTSYKTIDDFLKMPETALPDKQNVGNHCNNKKQKLYKSKFWENLKPGSSKNQSKCAAKNQIKRYDPEDVKGFIQKQKEMRRMQQMKESKEKEEEYEKRHKMLKELDSKCQRIASKAKQRSEMNTYVSHFVDEPKKSKLEIESSPSIKYLKPLITPRKRGSLLKKPEAVKSETAKQAQYLLAEFENIVKRECISFLQKIPVTDHGRGDNFIKKTDKAVGTTTRFSTDTEFVADDSDLVKHLPYPCPKVVENAAAKIQAFYRGYKVRQCLREAKISTSFGEKRKQFESELEIRRRTQRRWSFPKMPEKPYDNFISKLLPMSPIPMVAYSDSRVPGYIPPPPITSQAPRSPSRPKVLPIFPLTPVRLRIYDEPYPKHINQSSSDLHSNNFVSQSSQLLTPNNVLKRPSLPAYAKLNNSTVASSYIGKKSVPNLELVIPTPLPSIVDVLREKVRMFVDDNKNAASINNTKYKPVSYENEFESDVKSSEKFKSQNCDNSSVKAHHTSGNIEQEKVNLSVEKDAYYKTKKPKKRRSRSKTNAKKDGSTTTVDTDIELVSSTSQSSLLTSKRQRSSSTVGDNQTNVNSEESLSSIAGTESGFRNFLAPALRLRYEAERERLQIIEKALHIKLQNKEKTDQNYVKTSSSQPCTKEQTKKKSPESDRLQLAIANCQKESMKAAAEMTKWLAEFRKTVDHDKAQVQQTPIDIATMVYTAVEQARHMGEEKRRENVLKRMSDQNIQGQAESVSNDDAAVKADKSAQTSLVLMENYQNDILRSADVHAKAPSVEALAAEEEKSNISFEAVEHSDEQLSEHIKLDKTFEECSESSPDKFEELGQPTSEPDIAEELEETASHLHSQIENPTSENSGASSPYLMEEDKQVEVGVRELESDAQEGTVNETALEDAVVKSELETEVPASDSLDSTSLSSRSLIISPEKDKPEIITEEEKSNVSFDANEHSDEHLSEYSKLDKTFEECPESIPDKFVELGQSTSEPDIAEELEETASHLENSTSENSGASPKLLEEKDKLVEVSVKELDSDAQEGTLNETAVEDADVEPELETEVPASGSLDSTSLSSRSLIISLEKEKPEKITEEEKSNVSFDANENSDEHLSEYSKLEKTFEECLESSPDKFVELGHPTSEPDIAEELEGTASHLENSTSENSRASPYLIEEDKLVEVSVKELESDAQEGILNETALEDAVVKPELETEVPASGSLDSTSLSSRSPEKEKPERITEEEKSNISFDADEHSDEQLSEHIELDKASEECPESSPDKFAELGQSTSEPDIAEEFEEIASLLDSQIENSTSENSRASPHFLEEDKQVDVSVKELESDAQEGILNKTALEDALLKPELETEVAALKPVPPYSPSSSLDSTSLSSRSLIISLEKEKLERIIQQQTDLIWQAWNGNGSLPSIQTIVKMNNSNMEAQSGDKEINDTHPEAANAAIQSFDTLLCHLVYETIKEVLQVENSYTPYIERVRPGPLSLQAQRLRIPRTRESLVAAVMKLVAKIIPKTFFVDPLVSETEKPKLRKWCSKPRELVDEVLLEELVEEDYQWTEWWPEEVIVLNQVSEKIVKSLIRDTLKKRAYVSKH